MSQTTRGNETAFLCVRPGERASVCGSELGCHVTVRNAIGKLFHNHPYQPSLNMADGGGNICNLLDDGLNAM